MADVSVLNKEKLHTGIGSEIINATSYDDVLNQAGLNWTVDAQPIYTEINGTQILIPGSKTIVRNEDMKPLGIVSDKYQIVNNSEAFSFTESLFDVHQIEFIRGGSYRGGSSTWLEAKITGKYSILGDDTDCFLIFKNSHDGSGSVMCMILPTRIACSNALNLNLANTSRHWRCVHSSNVFDKMSEAQEILLAGSTYMKELDKEAEKLNAIKITDSQVSQFVNRLFPINDDMTDKTVSNIITRRERLTDTYYHKDDLANYDNNGYKFVSAVADYIDHVDGRNTKNANLNRFMNVAYGNASVDKAYEMILQVA